MSFSSVKDERLTKKNDFKPFLPLLKCKICNCPSIYTFGFESKTCVACGKYSHVGKLWELKIKPFYILCKMELENAVFFKEVVGESPTLIPARNGCPKGLAYSKKKWT